MNQTLKALYVGALLFMPGCPCFFRSPVWADRLEWRLRSSRSQRRKLVRR